MVFVCVNRQELSHKKHCSLHCSGLIVMEEYVFLRRIPETNRVREKQNKTKTKIINSEFCLC